METRPCYWETGPPRTKGTGLPKVSLSFCRTLFDPNGYNNNINVLFPLKSADGGIQVAQKQTGADFAILQKK